MLKKLKSNYIFLSGAFVLFIASVFSSGFHHFDEHFQILEFAGLKLGLTSPTNLPWEYHCQMRPSLQPALVVLLYRFFGYFGLEDPFFLTFFLRLLSGGLTFLTMMLMYKVYKNRISDENLKRWFIILSFTSWFIVYIGVRFSSENWSGLLFAIGFSFYFLHHRKNHLYFFIVGLLFGLSFLFRYQAAFLVFGFLSWLLIIKRVRFSNLISIVIGIVFIVAAGVLIDKWFYGEWTITSWNYFTKTIIEDKGLGFGVKPWWWYITKSIESGVPPLSILFVATFFIVILFKPGSPVVWSILPFFIIHSLIGHKEIRFLFPLCFFLPLITIQGIEVLQKKFFQHLASNKYMRSFMKLIFIVNTGILFIVMFKPADAQISLYRALYKNYQETTTLYCLEGNPYHRVLDIYFYKRKNLTVESIESIDDIPEGNGNLLALKHRVTSDNPVPGKLIYTTYPDWILKYNFNNWQDRSHSWYVYEINK